MDAIQKHHDYTLTLRVPGSKWEAKVSPSTDYGYFDHDVQGEGGGLWFEGKQLVDYDGRACLPREVAEALLRAGYELEHTEYVGDRIVIDSAGA